MAPLWELHPDYRQGKENDNGMTRKIVTTVKKMIAVIEITIVVVTIIVTDIGSKNWTRLRCPRTRRLPS